MLGALRLRRCLPVLLGVALLPGAFASAAVTGAAPVSVAKAGVISTVAGEVGGPDLATKVSISGVGLAVHGDDFYLADGTVVREVNTATDGLTTPAGIGIPVTGQPANGLATKATLSQTYGMTVDQSGNLVVADGGGNTIQVVAKHTGRYYGQAMTAGQVYSIAGTGSCAIYQGNSGLATAAVLCYQRAWRWTARATCCSPTRATT